MHCSMLDKANPEKSKEVSASLVKVLKIYLNGPTLANTFSFSSFYSCNFFHDAS